MLTSRFRAVNLAAGDFIRGFAETSGRKEELRRANRASFAVGELDAVGERTIDAFAVNQEEVGQTGLANSVGGVTNAAGDFAGARQAKSL